MIQDNSNRIGNHPLTHTLSSGATFISSLVYSLKAFRSKHSVVLYRASAILHKQNTSWTRNNKLFCTNAVLTLLYWYYSLIPQVSEKVNCFLQVMLSILWKLRNKLNDRFKRYVLHAVCSESLTLFCRDSTKGKDLPKYKEMKHFCLCHYTLTFLSTKQILKYVHLQQFSGKPTHELGRWEARQREKKFADNFRTSGILYSSSFRIKYVSHWSLKLEAKPVRLALPLY